MARILPLLFALALAPAPARADETDPEPPGGTAGALRKLKGEWTVARALNKGNEIKGPANWVYTFEGDKLTMDRGGRKTVMKLKVNAKKKPATLEMIPEGSTTGQETIFKIEKGELFLGMGKATTTFDGNTGVVLVLTPNKK